MIKWGYDAQGALLMDVLKDGILNAARSVKFNDIMEWAFTSWLY